MVLSDLATVPAAKTKYTTLCGIHNSDYYYFIYFFFLLSQIGDFTDWFGQDNSSLTLMKLHLHQIVVNLSADIFLWHQRWLTDHKVAAYYLGLGFWVNSQRKTVRIDANCNNGAPVGTVDRGRLQVWERDTRGNHHWMTTCCFPKHLHAPVLCISVFPHLPATYNFSQSSPGFNIYFKFLPSLQRARTPQQPSVDTHTSPTHLRPLFFIEQESNYLTQIQVPYPLWPSTLTSLH